jgi:hypothetical protein
MTDDGTVQWFGPSWGAPINDPEHEVPVPVGAPCARCKHPLGDGAKGVAVAASDGTRLPYALGCFLTELGIDLGYPEPPEGADDDR